MPDNGLRCGKKCRFRELPAQLRAATSVCAVPGQLGVAFRLADGYDLRAVREVLRGAGLPARLPNRPSEFVFIEVDSERQQTLAVQVLSRDPAFLDVHPALQVVVPRDD